jgi:predicted transcriptional regulator
MSDTRERRSEYLTFRVSEQMKSELGKIAIANDRTLSMEVIRAIRDYLARYEGDPSPGHSVKA